MSIGKTKKEPLKGPAAPYDGYDEREDTEEKARNMRLPKAWDSMRENAEQ